MDSLILARLQFAITTIYHFFFVPLTLGLSLLVALMETLYVRSGDEMWKRMTKFWGKLFLINFAMGVVTGIVQEFQFGMNWSEYARFVGDIFGVPLAIEALLAFFLESTFLGIWIFGWERLSKGMHLAAIWLVAIGANISALWILVANSFMQEPGGYTIVNGRALMTNFFALLSNANLWVQFPHVFFSGLTTGGFFILAISTYHVVKAVREQQPISVHFRRSFTVGAIAAVIGTVMIVLNGHTQAQHMVRAQPMKMAAAEALWESQDPASFSLITIGNEAERKDVFAIRIPRLLSLLAYNRLEGEVQGIRDLEAEYEATYGPGDYAPPIAISYWSFRIMVGVGLLMVGMAFYALWLVMRGRLDRSNPLLRYFVPAIGLPYLANTAGWVLTEMGRQPWIVYGLQKTADAVSPNVAWGSMLFSLIAFTLLYGALMAADVFLLTKYARQGPEESPTPSAPGAPEPAKPASPAVA
jgi:cytochrome d ubiquinol oxidase subunit I